MKSTKIALYVILFFVKLFAVSAYATTNTSVKADLIDGVTAPQNLLKNPTAQKNLQYWTASGGTFVRTTTASEIPNNADGAFSWDSNGAAQTVTTTAQAIPAGWYGKNGVVSCSFKCASGTCTHTLTATDGTNPLADAQTITSDTATFPRTSVNFIYPSSGNVQLKLASVNANEPKVTWGSCHLGLADEYNLSQVSQATLYGTATVTGCAAAWTTTSGTAATPAAVGSCSYAVTGGVSAPATNTPSIVLNNLPPGKYMVVASDFSVRSSGGGASYGAYYRLYDGTTASGGGLLFSGTDIGQKNFPGTTVGSFSYTTAQSSKQIDIQIWIIGGGTAGMDVGGSGLEFFVYRFPTSNETAYRPDLSGMSWSGYHDSTCSWSRTNTAYGAFTDDASCALVESSNVNFGTVSTNGSVSPAITWTPKKTGRYLVTAALGASVSSAGANAAYKLWDGTTTIAQQAFSNGASYYGAATLVGVYNATSTSAVTFTVQGKSASGNILIDGSYATEAIRWNIVYIDQNVPMPILVGGVTAPDYAGATKINTVVSKSGNYTATDAEETIIFSADATLTLPAAANFKGKKYHVQANGAGIDVTIDPNSTELVCGKSTITINGDGDGVTIQSNGTNWEGLNGGCLRHVGAKINCDAASTYSLPTPNDWLTSVGNNSTGCVITWKTGLFSANPICSFLTDYTANDDISYASTASANSFKVIVRRVGTSSVDYDGYFECMGPR